jgi:hypothetical protein
MRSRKGQWKADFPMREEVEDYAGRMRVFIINCSEGAHGFTVRAEEEGRSGNDTSSRRTARQVLTALSAD